MVEVTLIMVHMVLQPPSCPMMGAHGSGWGWLGVGRRAPVVIVIVIVIYKSVPKKVLVANEMRKGKKNLPMAHISWGCSWCAIPVLSLFPLLFVTAAIFIAIILSVVLSVVLLVHCHPHPRPGWCCSHHFSALVLVVIVVVVLILVLIVVTLVWQLLL